MDLSNLSKAIPSWGAPTLEDFDTSNIKDGQRLSGKNRQFVRFYYKKFQQPYTIEAKINPVTGNSVPVKVGTREVEREMVEIITPGDKNTVDDFAEDYHRREHWAAYKAFRDGRGAPLGKPLENCSYVSAPQVTELRYLGVHTEEQMADASDLLCDRVPNGHELREFARSMVKASRENQSLNEVNALKAQLKAMQEQMEAMQRAQALAATPMPEPELRTAPQSSEIKRSPGRPRGSTNQTTEV